MKCALLLLLASLATACAPKIYVVDRQTVLEEEAAGEWPQFEKDLVRKSKAQGPTPFTKTPMNASRSRLYNVLNGEVTSQPAPQAAPGAGK